MGRRDPDPGNPDPARTQNHRKPPATAGQPKALKSTATLDYLVTDPARTIALRSLAEGRWHLAAGPVLDLRRTFIDTLTRAATTATCRRACASLRYAAPSTKARPYWRHCTTRWGSLPPRCRCCWRPWPPPDDSPRTTPPRSTTKLDLQARADAVTKEILRALFATLEANLDGTRANLGGAGRPPA